ncbi:GAF domain-containing protein [Candidatus Amarobacter glycogenicus]|uniref:GAF domain-containing protein n=1 Tax=Candidatus Amarobacter glycogenicus TaxID=3140699 RepID=UPI002A0B911D|nr:GAF domain-containing protein [Dehalococcoidia bacterium]
MLLPVSAAALRDAVARHATATFQPRAGALRALVPLYEMSRMFMLQTDLDELLHRVLETAVNETGATPPLMLIDENRLYLTIQAAVGISTDVISQTQVRLGEGIAGWVAKTGQPLVVNGPDDLPEFLRQSMLGGVLRSALSLPLTAKGQVIGVINLTKTTLEAPFVLGDAGCSRYWWGRLRLPSSTRLIKQMEAASRRAVAPGTPEDRIHQHRRARTALPGEHCAWLCQPARRRWRPGDARPD